LKALNNLTSNALTIGQTLKLKDDYSDVIAPDLNNTYVVKSGDTLYSIANNYNTTVQELKLLNSLSSNILSLGQVLKLPVQELSSNTYIVKSGDTLYSIARKYNVSVDNLKDINNLTTNFLSIGQTLIIPSNNDVYTVKSGDTLYSIASKYNTSVNELKALNNLVTNNLSLGQKLLIP